MNRESAYSETFKKEAVLRVMNQNSSSYKASRELGVSQSFLSQWVKNFKEEGGSSVLGQEDAEMKKLSVKVKRLQNERDILKKTVSFFAKHEY